MLSSLEHKISYFEVLKIKIFDRFW